MYRITDDPRSIQSRKMLYDGLIQLMCEREFANITVTDLVKVAKVGRATFYRNFDTIEDILRLRCDQICEGFVEYYREYRQQNKTEPHFPRLKPMLRYFDEHSDMIELLMQANQLQILAIAIRRSFEPFLEKFEVEETYAGYSLRIRIGFAMSVLVHWIETGKQQAPDELADMLSEMMKNIVTREQLF